MSEYAVEMQDVLKQFVTPEGGILAAVNHVTMQIKDGEFFSLLGPSGCGKTTSLRMIAGFEMPFISIPNPIFCSTVMCGKRAYCWNTVLTGR